MSGFVMADNANKVRSPSKEKALDTRIREIQLRSKEREEKQRVIQGEAKTVRQVKVKENETESKANGTEKPKNLSNAAASKKQQNGREWDKGKSPAAEWKTNVPEMNDRRRAKQLPSSSTNRRNGSKPQNSNPNKPAAGFQHDDRFVEKPANADKEKTPDENRKPSGTQQARKTGQPPKRSVFSRGDSIPFQKRTPHQMGNRFRRANPFKAGQSNNEKTPNDSNDANAGQPVTKPVKCSKSTSPFSKSQ
ncbi:hypothetical protein M3Y97_00022100 [Aphelenchoides bicaudatus]|nr:hypothetical protein M3Y97_00022100 [Aphelenchoides bicaudatus]